MSPTGGTFGSQLRHFARSVDIVDDATFDDVRRLIYRYVQNELDASYFELMRDQAIDDEPGLKMFWSSDERDHTWHVRKPDQTYTNLVTLSFGTDRPIWIVAQDKSALADAPELTDEWSKSTDLPRYQRVTDTEIHMLVALPLRRKRRLGVCYFESRSHIQITEVAKDELLLLAESIAILLELYEVNRTQSEMTRSAIEELNDNLQSAIFPQLTRPHFFYGYSSRADPAVLTVITEVLEELGDKIEYTNWSTIHDSGNINSQIAKEITRSRFGICYFSEPNEERSDGEPRYGDNPNVVFEAGMLHARTAASESGDRGEPAGWIPMREEDSPRAPFDFASERILVIPRFPSGELNESRLREMLEARVNRLIG